MKLRKLLVSLLALTMLFSSMGMNTYAATIEEEFEDAVEYDFMAEVYLNNDYCEQEEAFAAIETSTLTLTRDSDGLQVNLPLMRNDEWESLDGYKDYEANDPEKAAYDAIVSDLVACYIEEIKSLLEEVDPELATVDSIKTKLAEVKEELGVIPGYSVTITGADAQHYTPDVYYSAYNRDLCIFEFDLIVKMYDEEDVQVETYVDLLNQLAQEEGFDDYEAYLKSLEYTAEEIKETMDEIAEMDVELAMARNPQSDFPSYLIVDVDLTCPCPEMYEYYIEHHYYKKVDGKLNPVPVVVEAGDQYDEAFEYHYYLGKEGDAILAKDYVSPVYDGETYEFVGSFDYEVVYDDDLWNQPYTEHDDYKMESFTVDGHNEGMILAYVLEEESGEELLLPDEEPDDPIEASPATGDKEPIGLYTLIIATAVAAMIVLKLYRKRRDDNEV